MAGFSSREDLGNADGILGRVWNWELVKENGCKELDTIKRLSTQAHTCKENIIQKLSVLSCPHQLEERVKCNKKVVKRKNKQKQTKNKQKKWLVHGWWCDLEDCPRFFGCVCVCCSVMSNPFVTPWTVARQGSLSMECSMQEFYSG